MLKSVLQQQPGLCGHEIYITVINIIFVLLFEPLFDKKRHLKEMRHFYYNRCRISVKNEPHVYSQSPVEWFGGLRLRDSSQNKMVRGGLCPQAQSHPLVEFPLIFSSAD